MKSGKRELTLSDRSWWIGFLGTVGGGSQTWSDALGDHMLRMLLLRR